MIQQPKTLKTQKSNAIQKTHSAKGFKDNPNVAAADKAIDKCIDALYNARGKLDTSSVDYPKEIMKAYAMPNANIPLDEEQAERLERVKEGKTMPLNMGNYLKRLGEIGMLARIRNELTNVATGTECHEILKVRYGFLTHMPNNCKGLPEEAKKRYIINMLDSIIEGFIAAVDGMKDKETQVVDFLERFTGACVEAKNDNIMDYVSLANNIVSSGRSDETNDLAYSITAEFNALADKVKTPFRDAARKEVEADVRAEMKVQFETKTAASTKFATATDMHATGVIKAAKHFAAGDMTDLIQSAKENMPPEVLVPDGGNLSRRPRRL